MRRFITLAALSLSLLGGGVAMADRGPGHRTERRRAPAAYHQRGNAHDQGRHGPRGRNDHDRPRIERARFVWLGGTWKWSGARWTWVPGHYERGR
jgi:hypothetical protein